jgi:hypothetical protein
MAAEAAFARLMLCNIATSIVVDQTSTSQAESSTLLAQWTKTGNRNDHLGVRGSISVDNFFAKLQKIGERRIDRRKDQARVLRIACL